MSEKKKLTTSGILEDLKQGLDRKAIGEKYGLKPFEVKELFRHPDLAKKKVRRADKVLTFELISDIPPTPPKNTKTSKRKDSPQATEEIAATQTNTTDQEEEQTAAVDDIPNSSGIKEVATEEDKEETAKEQPGVETKKGLW